MIDAIASKYLEAPELLENEGMLHFVSTMLAHFAGIQDFKILFKQYYVAQASRADVQIKKAVRKSRYKKYISKEFNEVGTSKDEIIRLGIIGLYHKYEAYRSELIIKMNEYLEKDNCHIDIAEYAELNYRFRFRDNWKNQTLFELSWLCNRIKHDNARPVDRAHPNRRIPEKFKLLPPDRKIIITSKEFYNYIDQLYSFCTKLFELIVQIGLRIQIECLDPENDLIVKKREVEDKVREIILEINNCTEMSD